LALFVPEKKGNITMCMHLFRKSKKSGGQTIFEKKLSYM